jgi:hypothetical protein
MHAPMTGEEIEHIVRGYFIALIRRKGQAMNQVQQFFHCASF